MAEELIAAWLVSEKGKPLDWAAGEDALLNMPDARVEQCLNDACREDVDDDPRETIREIIGSLREVLEAEYDRFLLKFDVVDRTVWFGGGSSYGDDPCVAFTVIADAMNFPEVLAAVGFDVELPEEEPVVPAGVTAPQYEPEWGDD